MNDTSATLNSFSSKATIEVGGESYGIHRLESLAGLCDLSKVPFSVKLLLENLLRNEDGRQVTAADIESLATNAAAGVAAQREIAFSPSRILLQDFTGVPCIVDLAAMRDAVEQLGGKPDRVNPHVPVDLVIDHSVVADVYARPDALAVNTRIEYERNGERYRFLRWGQQAFSNFRVVPPGTGICHQVNLEYLSRVVFTDTAGNAYPDSVVGTDSHTPMVNGLGILAWGAGGIEAEAAMLGQPISMLVPPVVGLRLSGSLPEGTTATDLVLTIAALLRRHGVVGKFVECYGPGVASVPLENRATIGNMSPEYGSTVTIFPIDAETLRYLRLTGRPDELLRLVETYAKEQGLWHDPDGHPAYSEHVELDLGSVEPSLAGPSRPQDQVRLSQSKARFAEALPRSLPEGDRTVEGGSPGGTAGAGASRAGRPSRPVPVRLADGQEFVLDHGHVVIAAITSCTNTSNPQVMIAAGLLAKNAAARGLRSKPWVKTTLAPGSRVAMDYFDRAGLTESLELLGFGLVGFGCTTCIGNSGPLLPEISEAINANSLACVSVLSGNRNFEGRIHPDVRMNYLASPPLVVAYALAGTMDIDLASEPLGTGTDGEAVFLRDIWPSLGDVTEVVTASVGADLFRRDYAEVFSGDDTWQGLDVPTGDRYAWDDISTYVRRPPYFDGMGPEPEPLTDVRGARVLAILGDSVTTDHISPAGSIKTASPAGQWLVEHGVAPADFNSYGARRGNHEVMIRGTFANTRIRNRLAPGTEGGVTLHLPDGEQLPVYDAAARYEDEGVPLVVLAGKEYGSGSSRDWAAKGPVLLGVRAVIAESFERIHRSNLIGMGVLPLQFASGDSVESLGLNGHEIVDIEGVAGLDASELVGRQLHVTVTPDDGSSPRAFTATLRIDTPSEADYLCHGGIMQFVARQLAQG
ncbi:MAG TPA: aconitate hydratase AcnA [Acidimicrobiales bacterium]|nr:aconitate hydratase AcnA [Acidimicrobiales bacterium]